MPSNKMVGLVLVRGSEKRSKTNFYCKNWEKLKVSEMLLVHVGGIPRHRKLV